MMDDGLKRIVKKIQKLLALAENAGTEEEAAAAMSMAREMLAKYELSLGQVREFTEDECSEAEFKFRKKYMPSYLKMLVDALNILYQCRAIHRKHVFDRNDCSIIFVGVGADAVVACQTLEFLHSFAHRKTKERGIRSKEKSDFLYGFAYAILKRVLDAKKGAENPDIQDCSLVPVKNAAIDKYLNKRFGQIGNLPGRRERKANAEMVIGYMDGKEANLDRPIEADKMQALAEKES